MNYLKQNLTTYDELAKEFEDKISLRKNGDAKIVNNLSKYFDDHTDKVKVLDIGPGNGQMALLLTQKGFQVTGIEFSKPMAEVAQKTAPKMKMVVDNFLTHDFGAKKFSGILAIAFIHLFPENECIKVIKKINELLEKDGYAMISTTKHDKSEEGLFSK